MAVLCRNGWPDQLFSFMHRCEIKDFGKKGCTSKAKLPWEMLYGEANCPWCGNPRLSHRLPFQSWPSCQLALVWKGRQTLNERLCLILGAKVGSGLRDGCRGELLRAGMDRSSRLEVGVQPAPWKKGEADRKPSRQITPGERRSESQAHNLGWGETWAVPVW